MVIASIFFITCCFIMSLQSAFLLKWNGTCQSLQTSFPNKSNCLFTQFLFSVFSRSPFTLLTPPFWNSPCLWPSGHIRVLVLPCFPTYYLFFPLVLHQNILLISVPHPVWLFFAFPFPQYKTFKNLCVAPPPPVHLKDRPLVSTCKCKVFSEFSSGKSLEEGMGRSVFSLGWDIDNNRLNEVVQGVRESSQTSLPKSSPRWEQTVKIFISIITDHTPRTQGP